jgi:hypothetical protein
MSSKSSDQALGIDPLVKAVEIKITAREKDEDVVPRALELADEEHESRQVYFFDTDELTLFDGGVALRARLVRDGADDSTVKLRPVVPSEVDARWLATEGFEIEVDVVGDDPVCSAKLSVDQKRDEISEVADGSRPLRKLFSQAQEDLIAEDAPLAISWDDLRVLGPVDVRKWEIEREGCPYEITVEEWLLPDGTDFVELSIKVEPDEAQEAGESFRAFLVEKQLDTEGSQQTKTRAALSYFTETQTE